MTSFILYLAKTLNIAYRNDLRKKIDNKASNKTAINKAKRANFSEKL
jgi:hypothetical protein